MVLGQLLIYLLKKIHIHETFNLLIASYEKVTQKGFLDPKVKPIYIKLKGKI